MRDIKRTHKPIKNFYTELKQYEELGATNETEVRLAFAALLQHYARQNNLTLICEKSLQTPQNTTIYVDGMLTDNDFGLPRGYWEAKYLHDNLAIAVRQKFDAGYPQNNILFTTQERAILYQDGQAVMDVDIADAEAFIRVLHVFFSYEQADIANWKGAVVEFKDKVPALGQRAAMLIQNEEKTNGRFQEAFTDFHRHCRLETEFGRSLSDSNVYFIDPFVGTGNFIVRFIQAIDKTALKAKYRDELHWYCSSKWFSGH